MILLGSVSARTKAKGSYWKSLPKNCNWLAVSVVAKKLIGLPEQALSDYQEQKAIDLTVMGVFGHTRIHDWLLGSFTVKMLMNSRKPLLLLR